jgi:hypothetical protein
MYGVNRPNIKSAFGIEVEPLDEFLISDYEARENNYYRDQIRYNQQKWVVAQQVLREWKYQNQFEATVLDEVAAIEHAIPSDVKPHETAWYIEQAKRRRDGKSTTPFESSYWEFWALFGGLKQARNTIGDRRQRDVLDKLILALSGFSNNEYPVEGLGFIPQTVGERKAFKAEKAAARRAVNVEKASVLNAAIADELLANVRARKRGSIAPH